MGQMKTLRENHPNFTSRQDIEKVFQKHDLARRKYKNLVEFVNQIKMEAQKETNIHKTIAKTKTQKASPSTTVVKMRGPDKENQNQEPQSVRCFAKNKKIETPLQEDKQISKREPQVPKLIEKNEIWAFIHRFENLLVSNLEDTSASKQMKDPPRFLSCNSITQSTQASHQQKTQNSFQQPQSGFQEEYVSSSPPRQFLQSNLLDSRVLLNKFECIRNQLGIMEKSDYTHMETSFHPTRNTLINSQNSESSDHEYYQQSNDFQTMRCYEMNQIEELTDETEQDHQHRYDYHTPSLQDIQATTTQCTNGEFKGFYDKQIKKSLEMIEKNIRTREISYTSSAKETYSSQQPSTKTQQQNFDTYYQNFVGEEVTGLEEDIHDMYTYLDRVNNTQLKLQRSLKDFYRTISFQQSEAPATTIATHMTMQHDPKTHYPSSSSITSYSTEKQKSNKYNSTQDGNENMNDLIMSVSHNLENIDHIRNNMLNVIERIRKGGNYNTNSLNELKGMKDQIQTHFMYVESAVKQMNQEYTTQKSGTKESDLSDHSTFKSHAYQTQFISAAQTDQSFDNYYKNNNWRLTVEPKQFQTQQLEISEVEDESSIQ